MKTLIKNGKIIADGDHCIPAEIWIEDGIIQAIGTTFSETGVRSSDRCKATTDHSRISGCSCSLQRARI